jgi:hypothetical protein
MNPYEIQIRNIGQTRTPGETRGGIRCVGGVSIPCWPVTHAVSPISKSGKRSQNQYVKTAEEMLWNNGQHSTQCEVVFTKQIVITTVELAKCWLRNPCNIMYYSSVYLTTWPVLLSEVWPLATTLLIQELLRPIAIYVPVSLTVSEGRFKSLLRNSLDELSTCNREFE